MLVFYGFLFFCFVSSLILGRKKPVWRTLSLLAMCALLVFVYYFLHRI
jgi:hypothetical protein